MRTGLAFRVVLLALAALSAATPAMAQDPPLNRTRVELAVGEDVLVTTKDGTLRKGRLVRANQTEIAVLAGRRRFEIPMTDIRQIDRLARSVSVRKTTVIGLGVGLAVGAVALASGGCSEDAGTFVFECVGFFTGLGAGIGAGTGVLINALRPARAIFRADQRRAFTLAPVVSKNLAGVSGTIRW